MVADSITVAITNWRRPEFLQRSLGSAFCSGFDNVVVYSAEPPAQSFKLIEHWEQRPGRDRGLFKWAWTPRDPGNNECWLRATAMVETPYMILLHDDDVLVPSGVFVQAVESLEAGGALALWDGHNVSDGKRVQSLHGDYGVRNSDDYRRWLLGQPRSVSPGCALWRTDHVLQVLTECAENLKSPDFFTRPTMMVGNDLLLHLRATDWGGNFKYFPEMPLGFGDHPGSETYAALRDPVKYHGLHRAYEATKQYFLAHDERKWVVK